MLVVVPQTSLPPKNNARPRLPPSAIPRRENAQNTQIRKEDRIVSSFFS